MSAARLDELGIALPPPFPPAGNYLACVVDGGLLHVGGHGPIAGATMVRGKVGTDLTLEQAQRAARMTALSILATVAAELLLAECEGKPAGVGALRRLPVGRAVPRPHSQTELRGSRHGPERLVEGRQVLVALADFDRPAQTFVQHSRK